jgi:hypothetical protein
VRPHRRPRGRARCGSARCGGRRDEPPAASIDAPLADPTSSRSILDQFDPQRSHLYVRQYGAPGNTVELAGQAGGAATFYTSFAVPAAKYTHLVVTWDSSATRVVNAYVDGVLVGTDAPPNGWTPSDQRFVVSYPACCGGWLGDLDELRLYRRPLTLQEVQLVP